KKASEIHDLVRGLSPWPVATAVYKGVCIKIHSTAPAGECRGEPGEITETGKRLLVCCGDRRALEIKTLQAPGKKAMSAPDFMRGHSIMTGESFDK
ncbi:MAG: methionyl-tRNA formyltransferase, partial [Clostridia bacterium]|nr:methionyl-tRNA formyltransferase [Clostridia bacterium]